MWTIYFGFCFIFDFRSAKCFHFFFSSFGSIVRWIRRDALSLFSIICLFEWNKEFPHISKTNEMKTKGIEELKKKPTTTTINSGCEHIWVSEWVCVRLFDAFRLKQYYVHLYRQIETDPMYQTEHITSVSAIFKRIPIVLTPNYTRTALKPIAFSSYCCSDFSVLTVLPRSISQFFVLVSLLSFFPVSFSFCWNFSIV